MPSGKSEAATFHQLAALAAAQPEEQRTRRTAAEQAYTGVLSRLGAAGTYETRPSLGLPTETAGTPTPELTPDIFKTEKVTSGAATAIDPRYSSQSALQDVTSINQPEYQKQLEKSAQFRIASRLTAEAEQLISREGPLYNEMMNNVQLPILEGMGVAARENAEALKKAAARGGSARRTAMEAVQRIRSQNQLNSQKVQQLAQTRLAIDKWARENAQNVLTFGQNWASNLGGIRESYNQAMDKASELMLNSALPIMFAAKQEAAKWRYYAHQKNRQKVGNWISGIIGVGSMLLGGAGALSSVTSLPGVLGTIGKAAGPYTGALTSTGISGLTEAGGGGTPYPSQGLFRG